MARTIAELAVAAGLQDPDEWYGERRRRADLPQNRCLGHTTNMLLEALQATEDGKRVRIASYHSLQYADDLTRRLRRYAEILGLKQSLISRPIKHGMDNYHLRGWEGVVFTDHYIGEWP